MSHNELHFLLNSKSIRNRTCEKLRLEYCIFQLDNLNFEFQIVYILDDSDIQMTPMPIMYIDESCKDILRPVAW